MVVRFELAPGVFVAPSDQPDEREPWTDSGTLASAGTAAIGRTRAPPRSTSAEARPWRSVRPPLGSEWLDHAACIEIVRSERHLEHFDALHVGLDRTSPRRGWRSPFAAEGWDALCAPRDHQKNQHGLARLAAPVHEARRLARDLDGNAARVGSKPTFARASAHTRLPEPCGRFASRPRVTISGYAS